MTDIQRLKNRYERLKYAGRRWGIEYLSRKSYPYLVASMGGLLHPLPNLLILGAQKCGTSSFHDYLASHPGTFPSLVKEIHYFDHHCRQKPSSWYRAHFPYGKRTVRDAVVFESTPNYLPSREAPERVRGTLNEPRFIVLLRDPVERAYSHYLMSVRNGRENRTFEEAINAQIDKYHVMGFERQSRDAWQADWHDFHYVGKSLYERQVRNWFRSFDRRSFLFLESEQLFESPESIMSRVADFLNLSGEFRVSFPIRNRHRDGEAPINPALRGRLNDLFRQENQSLNELANIEFSWN